MAREKKQTDFAGFRVEYDEYRDVTRESTGEPYSGEDTSSSWTINGIVLDEKYPDITACFEVKAGDPVYLVYVVYSTGDSFSRNEDGCIKFIDLFKTHEKAVACATAIREHSDLSKSFDSYEFRKQARKEQARLQREFDAYSVEYVRENGEKVKEHASWNGYFDHLSYIEVASFAVDQRRRY